jgi:hypothetical protein
MKIVGGPRNGQEMTIAEFQGGPEIRVPGMILEYVFTAPGSVQIKMSQDLEPKPSVPNLIERYVCRDGAWQYIPPLAAGEYMITPPVVME